MQGIQFLKSTGANCKGLWVQLMAITAQPPKAMLHPAIRELLDNYTVIFKEPEVLPLTRSYDHKIILQEGAKPTCARPYH